MVLTWEKNAATPASGEMGPEERGGPWAEGGGM